MSYRRPPRPSHASPSVSFHSCSSAVTLSTYRPGSRRGCVKSVAGALRRTECFLSAGRFLATSSARRPIWTREPFVRAHSMPRTVPDVFSVPTNASTRMQKDEKMRYGAVKVRDARTAPEAGFPADFEAARRAQRTRAGRAEGALALRRSRARRSYAALHPICRVTPAHARTPHRRTAARSSRSSTTKVRARPYLMSCSEPASFRRRVRLRRGFSGQKRSAESWVGSFPSLYQVVPACMPEGAFRETR